MLIVGLSIIQSNGLNSTVQPLKVNNLIDNESWVEILDLYGKRAAVNTSIDSLIVILKELQTAGYGPMNQVRIFNLL